jgi:hypothetical protein
MDGGVRNVITEYGVVRGDVFRADYTAEDGIGGFAGYFGLAPAFDDEVAVGKGIDDTNGDARGDAFRVVDLATAVEGLFGSQVQGGEFAIMCEKSAGTWTVKETLDGGIDAGTFAGAGIVLDGGGSVLLDHDGQNVTDGMGPIIGEHGACRVVGPKGLGGKRDATEREGQEQGRNTVNGGCAPDPSPEPIPLPGSAFGNDRGAGVEHGGSIRVG